jgi:hypothetical protein
MRCPGYFKYFHLQERGRQENLNVRYLTVCYGPPLAHNRLQADSTHLSKAAGIIYFYTVRTGSVMRIYNGSLSTSILHVCAFVFLS